MAKRLRKGEKLDLILGELSELRADMAKLLKRQAEGADPKAGARPRTVRAKPAKKARNAAGSNPKTRAKLASSKPVLVEAPPDEQPQATSRIA
jgi:hypothetical protein